MLKTIFSLFIFLVDELLQVLKSDWFDAPDNYSFKVNSSSSTPTAGMAANWMSYDCDNEERKFFCDCGRAYKSKGSLTDHKRWECGKDPTFQCPYCEYCAKRKKHLRRHVICVHKQEFKDTI